MKDNNISEAIKILQKALNNDKDYYKGWQSAIALSIKDEIEKRSKEENYRRLTEEEIKTCCDQGAKNFLDILMNPCEVIEEL